MGPTLRGPIDWFQPVGMRSRAGRPSERAMVVASTERTATSAIEASRTGPSGAGTYQPATSLALTGVRPTWMASSLPDW